MTFNCFIAYFVILFIATITPGPSMLLAINHGVNHGVGRSIFSALGNVTGNLLMALASIVGLGAVLLASGFVFNIIKWAGIIYLAAIGIKLLLGPVKTDDSNTGKVSPAGNKGKRMLFVDGFVIAVGNPKGILFFTALFPQFVNIQSATIISFIAIFITLGLVAFGCYMLYAASGAKLSKLFRSYSFKKIFNRIAGSIFMGTGLALAFTKK